jgi:uncharacterized protein (TIRG00374 family)
MGRPASCRYAGDQYRDEHKDRVDPHRPDHHHRIENMVLYLEAAAVDEKSSAQSGPPPGARGSVDGQPSPLQKKSAAIESARQHPPARRALLKRAVPLVLAGATIYVLFPAITKVLGAWPRLSSLEPIWLTAALAAEVASFTCNFGLQRLALRAERWFAVVTAGLAGNSVTSILPGGAAAGAAVQFRMLSAAGFDTDTAIEGLTALSLIGTAGMLGLPLFAAPAMIAGIPVSPDLAHAALIGLAGFALFAGAGALVLSTDRPLATAGRVAQKAWNWLTRGRHPVTGLDQRLLADRDAIRTVLGEHWRKALLLSTGRLGFDYGCLLAALHATGSSPQPSLVLLAYAAAGILAFLPITPGGLGIVEAGLSSLLILAGVHPANAFLATLAYRLASYWLPLVSGLPAYVLFRHRYGRAAERPSGSDSEGARDDRPSPSDR